MTEVVENSALRARIAVVGVGVVVAVVRHVDRTARQLYALARTATGVRRGGRGGGTAHLSCTAHAEAWCCVSSRLGWYEPRCAAIATQGERFWAGKHRSSGGSVGRAATTNGVRCGGSHSGEGQTLKAAFRLSYTFPRPNRHISRLARAASTRISAPRGSRGVQCRGRSRFQPCAQRRFLTRARADRRRKAKTRILRIRRRAYAGLADRGRSAGRGSRQQRREVTWRQKQRREGS